MRAAKTELAAAERRGAEAQNSRPLRTARALHSTAGRPQPHPCGQERPKARRPLEPAATGASEDCRRLSFHAPRRSKGPTCWWHRTTRCAGTVDGGKVEIPPKESTRDSHFPTIPTATAAGLLFNPTNNPPVLDAASHSNTSVPPGGYDVGRLYHRNLLFERPARNPYNREFAREGNRYLCSPFP